MARMGLYPDAPEDAVRRRLRGRRHDRSRLGEGVTALTPGERVIAGTQFGGYAAQVVVARRQTSSRCPTS